MIFAYGGNLVNWPTERGFRGSLTQPHAPIAWLTALVLLAACTAIGTLIVRQRFFLGGLLAGAAGFGVWAVRGGTMTYVLDYASSTGTNNRVFLQLLAEHIVLGGAVAGIWLALWNRRPPFMQKPQPQGDKGRSTGAALVAQAALMVILVLILLATPQKKQVLAGVFLAGLVSTAVAEQFFADRSAARWYWVAPLAAGILGYVAAFISPDGLESGDLKGNFAALARALPLDYASLGMAGVLVGYWWMMPQEDGTPVEETEQAPVQGSDS